MDRLFDQAKTAGLYRMHILVGLVELTDRLIPKLDRRAEGSSINNSDRLNNIYAENYGCAANKFDFEIIIGSLVNAGYNLCKDVKKY